MLDKPLNCRKNMASRHLGIISQRALAHWRRLPAAARSWYDVEDMIGDVVLHVVRVSRKHDPAKARESTWVWHVADNRCRTIVHHYRTKQYAACETVELTPFLEGRVRAESTLCRRESIDVVERVLEAGSDAVCDLLEMLFSGKVEPCAALDAYLRKDASVVEELRSLVRDCGATLDDFSAALRYAVE